MSNEPRPLRVVAFAILVALPIFTYGLSDAARSADAGKARIKKAAPETCMNVPGGGRFGKLDGKKAFATILWTNTNTLNVAFKDGDDPWNRSVQEKLKEIVKEWEDYANIRFTFDSKAPADVAIQFVPDAEYPDYGIYQSLLGPNSRGENPSMWLLFAPQTDDGELRRVILHEFGHALGLVHEQKRPDVNLQWHEEKVYDYYKFTGWSKAEIFEQVMKPVTDAALDKTPFDTTSIMIYPIPKGLANIEVGWTKDLSPMDKAFIARVYPFKAPSLPEKVLEVGAEPVEGKLASAGQVARYRFAAPKGRYTIETSGPSPVLFGLFGPTVVPTPQGGAAAEGMNAKLAVDLDPKNFPAAADDPPTYRLEVRHQRPRTGSGPFSIRVRGN